MKHFFAAFLLLVLAVNANAQTTGYKGLVVQASTVLYIENEEPKSASTDELYAVSFTDKILTHAIYTKGSISNAQIYRIENDINFANGDVTVYKFDAFSGISGSKYSYEIKIDKDGKLLSLKRTQPNGTVSVFKGSILILKTYKQ